jgi:hypothetical protein
MLFDQGISAGNAVALRTASERGKLLIAMPLVSELPWVQKSDVPSGARLMYDPHESQIPPNGSQVVSDSGELKRNWVQGVFTIETPRTEAAMGRIGGKTISLAKIEMTMGTEDAAIAVQSLDGNPIGQSRKIMVSLGARSVPKAIDSLPFYSEPVEGKILISAPPGLSMRAWDARTRKLRRVSTAYRNGHYLLTVDRTLRSSWLLLGPPRDPGW